MASDITIVVFGFKYGLPRVNNYVDVSFLKNPAREFGLASRIDERHRDFVRSQPLFAPLIDSLCGLSETIIRAGDRPRMGIGCSAGRHRSRVVAEELARRLERSGYSVNVIFEDLEE